MPPLPHMVSLKITANNLSAEEALNLSRYIFTSIISGTLAHLEEIGGAGVSGLIKKQVMHSIDGEQARMSSPGVFFALDHKFNSK